MGQAPFRAHTRNFPLGCVAYGDDNEKSYLRSGNLVLRGYAGTCNSNDQELGSDPRGSAHHDGWLDL